MKSLKTFLIRYEAFFKGLAASLGIWGVLVISAVDAAAFGIPMDPLVGYYVWTDPHRLVLYCLMASLGSAIGSLAPYWIGRGGGELLVLKHVDRHRLERWRDRFEEQEFFFIMVPAMLPPPTPFKLIVLSTGVFEMRVPLFLAAVFTGRMLRFLLLSFLVLRFGPKVIEVITAGAKRHGLTMLAVLAVLVLAGLLWQRLRSRRRTD